MPTIAEVAAKLGRNAVAVRTLILARKINVVRVGRAFGLAPEAIKQLESAFAEIDARAEALGMATGA